MARPKRPTGLSERLNIRLSELERKVVAEQAQKAALTISEYVRRRALGIRVVSRFDDEIVRELRRLGAMQKHLAQSLPSQSAEFHSVVDEIIEAIKRIRER